VHSVTSNMEEQTKHGGEQTQATMWQVCSVIADEHGYLRLFPRFHHDGVTTAWQT
jgi:hypothetical protein